MMNCISCADSACPHIGTEHEACDDWTSLNPEEDKTPIDPFIQRIDSLTMRVEWLEDMYFQATDRMNTILAAVVKAANEE